MQIIFLEEGSTDDATMSFYASLGAEDPNNVTIAPPWPEEASGAAGSPKADSQREESTDSGDSVSGVILVGASAEADSTEVNSRTSCAPEGDQTTSGDETPTSAVADKGKESGGEEDASTQGPESPKLVRMEEGKAVTAGDIFAGLESADAGVHNEQVKSTRPATPLEPAQIPSPASVHDGVATVQMTKDLTSGSGGVEGGAQPTVKEPLDQKAKEAAIEGGSKECMAASDPQLATEVSVEADWRQEAPIARKPSSSEEFSVTELAAPSETEEITEASVVDDDDAPASKAKSAEMEADIAAVDKVKAIMQVPYNPVGPLFKPPGKVLAHDAQSEELKENSKAKGSKVKKHPATPITDTDKEPLEAGHSSDDQAAEVSVSLAGDLAQPTSARLEKEGEPIC